MSALKNKKTTSAVLGAAFLMATSAIGPGFITQTTVFTKELLGSFGFVILVSIVLDIAAQLNIWRIITMSGKPAQQIANEMVPGLGHLLSLLIVLGGLAFNIGNIAGAGLGIQILFSDSETQFPLQTGVWISAMIALVIFWYKDVGKAMDLFSKALGGLMIMLTLYVVFRSKPDLGIALHDSILPNKIDLLSIITLVGGTVGGYISFAGAHRLLDAGITGREHTKEVQKGSIQAILIASSMRVLLFLAAFGVVSAGITLNSANPAASVFESAAGNIGLKIFGLVLWSASITSVVGSAYTSISFLKTMHSWLEKNQRIVVTLFILLSTLIFTLIGKPVNVLILAGALNGVILPVSLGLMLWAINRSPQIHKEHPQWLKWAGWFVVLIMSLLSVKVIIDEVGKL